MSSGDGLRSRSANASNELEAHVAEHEEDDKPAINPLAELAKAGGYFDGLCSFKSSRPADPKDLDENQQQVLSFHMKMVYLSMFIFHTANLVMYIFFWKHWTCYWLFPVLFISSFPMTWYPGHVNTRRWAYVFAAFICLSHTLPSFMGGNLEDGPGPKNVKRHHPIVGFMVGMSIVTWASIWVGHVFEPVRTEDLTEGVKGKVNGMFSTWIRVYLGTYDADWQTVSRRYTFIMEFLCEFSAKSTDVQIALILFFGGMPPHKKARENGSAIVNACVVVPSVMLYAVRIANPYMDQGYKNVAFLTMATLPVNLILAYINFMNTGDPWCLWGSFSMSVLAFIMNVYRTYQLRKLVKAASVAPN